MDENTKEVNCIATGNAHLETVTGVALCHTAANFFVSVSKDLCLKVWEFSKDLTQKGKINYVFTFTPILDLNTKLLMFFFRYYSQSR